MLRWDELFITRLSVAHPAQDDLRGSVPSSHHVSRHLAVGLPRQTKVQDLTRRHVHLTHSEEAGVVNALIARSLVVVCSRYLELTVFVDGEVSWFEVLQKKYRKYDHRKVKYRQSHL